MPRASVRCLSVSCSVRPLSAASFLLPFLSSVWAGLTGCRPLALGALNARLPPKRSTPAGKAGRRRRHLQLENVTSGALSRKMQGGGLPLLSQKPLELVDFEAQTFSTRSARTLGSAVFSC